MRVLLLNLAQGMGFQSPSELLAFYRSLTGWVEGLAAAGAEVTVVQGFSEDATLELGGATYYFVAGPYDPRLRSWKLPRKPLRLVTSLEPQIVHIQSLLYPLQARLLRSLLPSSTVLVAQHHAERPFDGLRGRLQRWGLRSIDGFFFTGAETAAPWVERDLVPQHRVIEIPEGSLQPAEPDTTAAAAVGKPAILWIGNLDDNKDPVTVLRGFAELLRDYPRAHLRMVFRRAPLLERVEEMVRSHEGLAAAVSLLGERSHPEVMSLLRGSDLFVSGSHREGSGYSLIDAMAAGTTPVVTNIPSFRYLAGHCGALWEPGCAEDLLRALQSILNQDIQRLGRKARDRYRSKLSFEAIGQQAVSAYTKLHQRRTSSEPPTL